MLEKKNLPEFAQKVISAKIRFSIRDMDGELNLFAATQRGNAKLVYWERNKDKIQPPDSPDELFAIVVDGTVYCTGMLANWVFQRFHVELPCGMKWLEDKWLELDTQVRSIIQQFFENELEPAKLEDLPVAQRRSIKSTARALVLGATLNGLDNWTNGIFWNTILPLESVIAILAGETDIQAAAQKLCDQYKQELSKNKGFFRAVKELAADPDLVEPWERRLHSCLQEAPSWHVGVEFCKNGNTASVVIEISLVLHKLVNQAPFFKSNFEIRKGGQEVIEALCPEKSSHLYCSDISRILIGNQVLYERNAG